MFEDADRYPGPWSYRPDQPTGQTAVIEQVWKEFVKWCHRLATSAENGFITEWPGVELMTTEQVLTKYPPAKDERLRSELLVRASKEMSGIHCVHKAQW